MTLKKPLDWPLKSPVSVRKVTTFMAMPFVAVGRMTEQGGSLRLRKGQGSGMMRLVWNSSPPKGGELRSGKVTETPVTGSVALRGGASPASSDQVWKCM